jgi:hypothetical protein
VNSALKNDDGIWTSSKDEVPAWLILLLLLVGFAVFVVLSVIAGRLDQLGDILRTFAVFFLVFPATCALVGFLYVLSEILDKLSRPDRLGLIGGAVVGGFF